MKRIQMISLLLFAVAAVAGAEAFSWLEILEFGLAWGSRTDLPDACYGANVGAVFERFSIGIEARGNMGPPEDDIDNERLWDWGDWVYVDNATNELFNVGLYAIWRIELTKSLGISLLGASGVSTLRNFEKNYDTTLEKYWYTLDTTTRMAYAAAGVGIRIFFIELIGEISAVIPEFSRPGFFLMVNMPLKYIASSARA